MTTPRNYEPLIQEIYEAILNEGDIALDIGAHRGRHAIPLAERVFPGGKVFAFEPLPVCREALAKEVAAYRPELARVLTVYPYALGDSTGETEFIVAADALAYSGLRRRPYDEPTRLERLRVRVMRLDELTGDLPALRFVKLDVEGGEYHVLRGAQQTLRRFRPVVVFELGAGALDAYGATPADMARFWAEHDYRLYDILGNHLTADDLVRSARDQQVWDYVAIPADDAALEKKLLGVLTRPPAWHRITAHVEEAEHTADVGLAVPRLIGFRGLRYGLARLVAWLVVRLSQVLTRPQRACNRSLLRALRALTHVLRHQERVAASLQETVGALNERLRLLEQMHRDERDRLARALAERNAHVAELEGILNRLQAVLPGKLTEDLFRQRDDRAA